METDGSRKPRAVRRVHLTPEKIEALLSELDQLPPEPVGAHLATDEVVAVAIDEVPPADVPRYEAHLATCATCASAVEGLVDSLEHWEGPHGAHRLAALTERIRVTRAAADAGTVPPIMAPRTSSMAAKVRELGAQLSGDFLTGLQAQFEQLRTMAARTHGLTAAAAPVRSPDTAPQNVAHDQTQMPTIQRRIEIGVDGTLIFVFASDDITLEGLRVSLTIGGLRSECVLERVAKDQLLGEMKFPQDDWWALPANAVFSLDVRASPTDADAE